MNKLDMNEDVYSYMSKGISTQPFMDSEQVLDSVGDFYKQNIKSLQIRFKKEFKMSLKEKGMLIGKKLINKQANDKIKDDVAYINSIIDWIYSQITIEKDKNVIERLRFNRNAEEIFRSGKIVDANDIALLFTTFAKQLRLPTAQLYTIDKNKIENVLNGEKYCGHIFCECYCGDKWYLVDPAFRKIAEEYDPNSIKITYLGKGEKTYVAYDRQVDKEQKGIANHLENQRKLLKEMIERSEEQDLVQ